MRYGRAAEVSNPNKTSNRRTRLRSQSGAYEKLPLTIYSERRVLRNLHNDSGPQSESRNKATALSLPPARHQDRLPFAVSFYFDVVFHINKNVLLMSAKRSLYISEAILVLFSCPLKPFFLQILGVFLLV